MDKVAGLFALWAQRKQRVKFSEQPINLQTNDLDVQVDESVRHLLLRRLFNRSDISLLDGLNEYDEDYTFFTARGDLTTHEMQRAVERMTEMAEQHEDDQLKQEQSADYEIDKDDNGSA